MVRPRASQDGPRPTTDTVESPERRRFLTRISLWLSGLAAGLVGLPVIGYLLAPLFNQPRPEWIDLGPIEAYPLGQTVLQSIQDPSPEPYAGLTAATAVYVRREQPAQFDIFAVNCTHLGCPVNWLPTADLFLCPCHGGVFYRDGAVAAGPPQHPLYQYIWRLDQDHLFVQTMPLPPAKPWTPLRRPGQQAG